MARNNMIIIVAQLPPQTFHVRGDVDVHTTYYFSCTDFFHGVSLSLEGDT
jgi:hypothetical protein